MSNPLEPGPGGGEDTRRDAVRDMLARRYHGAIPVTAEMVDAVLRGLDEQRTDTTPRTSAAGEAIDGTTRAKIAGERIAGATGQGSEQMGSSSNIPALRRRAPDRHPAEAGQDHKLTGRPARSRQASRREHEAGR